MDKKFLINNTVDVKYYRKQLILISVISLIFILVALIGVPSNQNVEKIATVIAFLAFFSVMASPCIYKLVLLCRDPDRYEVLIAHASTWHYAVRFFSVCGLRGIIGTVYLKILITDDSGEQTYVKTNVVFSKSVLSRSYYGNFFGRDVAVLYDKTQGTVLVIDATDE